MTGRSFGFATSFWMVCVFAGASNSMAQKMSVPLATGTLEVLSGPTDCNGQACYELSVSCPAVAAPARAMVTVAEASGARRKGTILFTTGGPGTQAYEDVGYGPDVLAAAREAGFQTAQLNWIDSWLIGARDREEGPARLACRPATVARWVHERLASPESANAFCATGHSGGAAQISYMLSHYGLEELLDAVLLSGGPPLARLDLSCNRGQPANANVAFPDWATNIIDAGFGYWTADEPSESFAFSASGSGPCARGDESFLEKFRAASVASGDGDYVYPNTMVWFVFEGIDDTRAVAQGMLYHDLIISEGSPHVRRTVVPDVSHFGDTGLYETQAGANQVRDDLLSACRVWE